MKGCETMPYGYWRPCPPGTMPYIIKPGDTYYGIARKFNTTVSALVAANPYVNPYYLIVGMRICVPVRQQYPPCPEGNYYTVKEGDTLYSLAKFFMVSVDEIIRANPGIDPDRLMVGQVICIPRAAAPITCPEGSVTYTIKPGDTFYSIALKYNITVVDLTTANPNVNPNALLVGQVICIPKAK